MARFDDYEGWWSWAPRPSLTARRAQATLEAAKLKKAGRTLAPIVITGRTIAQSVWGAAWCKNLESYSDYANRLPRGRSYVRNGLVLHLEIAAGSVKALVRGSSLYDVDIAIAPVPKVHWKSICRDSAGAIDSLVELLQGRFSAAVMDRMCRQQAGLFPTPKKITFECSCPDAASMCKHVSAVLYGVGARLDREPELLFRLRRVDENDLIAQAGEGVRVRKGPASKAKVLGGADLSELFGLQMADGRKRRPVKKGGKKGGKRTGRKAGARKRRST